MRRWTGSAQLLMLSRDIRFCPPPCSVAQKVEDFLALGKVIDEPMVRRPLLGRGGDPRGP
jgi:hypothetical protein